MKRKLWLLLTVGLLLAADTPKEDAARKEAERFQGTWKAVSAERDGKADDEIKTHVLVVAGDVFNIKAGEKVLYKGTFKLDPTKKPATIDFLHSDGALKGRLWKGIYALDGDSLKICDNAPNLEQPRPMDFATAANSGHVLVVFKRGK